jgi:phosphoribosyl-AMP cyclohydrolase
MDEIIKQVKFDANGLVCAVIQDDLTNEVLMVAYMNKESLVETLETGKCCYWSRSRQKLWRKGETSGHVQAVRAVRIDCDGDALLFRVTQEGGACHTGYRSCFYRQIKDNKEFKVVGTKVFDEKDVYKT